MKVEATAPPPPRKRSVYKIGDEAVSMKLVFSVLGESDALFWRWNIDFLSS